jgi:hypothetical protein
LRSATVSNSIKKLEILATRNDERSKAIVLYNNNASNTYDPSEDSYKLFMESLQTPVQVYTRSSDGYALDINATGNTIAVIPLGIRTSAAGSITLTFSGMESLDGTKLYLHDTKEQITIDLSLQAEYPFTKKAEDALYLEDRFYLSASPNAPTDLREVEEMPVSILSVAGGIEILSRDGSPIRSIRIANTQGRYLVNEEHLSVVNGHYPLAAGIYIVRVGNERGSETRKVVVKQ